MRERARLDELLVDLGERTRVDADLHEARPDTRALDTAPELGHEAGRELRGRLRVRVLRHRDVAGGAVVAGVGHDLQPARVGEAAQQLRVAPEVGRRALEERAAAPPRELLEVGQHRAVDGIRVVARPAGRGSPAEVDQHVLVDERRAELRGVERSTHALDDALADAFAALDDTLADCRSA
jgi:hypothetical protein